MIMKIDSAEMLEKMMRTCDRDYFSRDGYEFLLENYEEEFEFDPVVISSEWNEYGDCVGMSYEDMLYDYGYLIDLPSGIQLRNMLYDTCNTEREALCERIYDELCYSTEVAQLSNGDYIVREF